MTLNYFYIIYLYTMTRTKLFNDEVKDFVNKKFASLSNQFNEAALSNSNDDDSYNGEEPWMSYEPIVCEADNVITNTWINPFMFEDGIDLDAWNNVLALHSQAHNFEGTEEVSEEELDKREEPQVPEPEQNHYKLMEVKRCASTNSVRRFYWNWVEGYETWNEEFSGVTEIQDDPMWFYIDVENMRKQENKKKVIPILYKRLGESRKGMKLAALQKHWQLYDDFKKEYSYCSKMLDKIEEQKQQKIARKIKARKDRLYTLWIKYNNLWWRYTIKDVKRMIDSKSLSYAEKVIEKWLMDLLPKEEQTKHAKFLPIEKKSKGIC